LDQAILAQALFPPNQAPALKQLELLQALPEIRFLT